MPMPSLNLHSGMGRSAVYTKNPRTGVCLRAHIPELCLERDLKPLQSCQHFYKHQLPVLRSMVPVAGQCQAVLWVGPTVQRSMSPIATASIQGSTHN